MPNVSLPVANTTYVISGVILVIGAVLALVGTLGTFWSGAIRDRFADERISKNEAETAAANAEAARANERAAELDREAAALKIELQQRTEPLVSRTVTAEQAANLKENLSGHPSEITLVWLGGDPEISEYVKQLERAFSAAGSHVAKSSIGDISVRGHIALPVGVNLSGPIDANFKLIEGALVRAGISFGREGLPSGVLARSTKLIVGPRRQLKE